MSDHTDFPKDVLIVDDSINNLNLLEGILKSVPYRVRMALNAEIAIRSIKAKLPDIILLDIHLPGLDGFSLCRQLKSSEPTKGIPIIFITASDNPEELQEAFACGAADFIRKPFNKDEVAARISTHLSLSMVTNELKAKNIALIEEMQEKTKSHLLLSSDQEALKSFIAESQNALDDCRSSSFAYHRFCDLMRELTGASYAVFNLFEESGDFFNTIAISGIAGLGPGLPKLLGFNLGGKRWPRDPERDKKIDGKQIALFDSIEALAGDSLPYSLSASVQRAFNVGIIAVVNIRRTNQSLGDFTLIFKRDEAFRNHELALILADYVGILIERRRITAHLEENDALFTQFLKYSPIYAFIKEVKKHDSFTIRMSDNYSEMLGRPTSELLGKGMREMFPSEFAEKMIEDDFSVVRSGKVVELDEQFNGRTYTTIKFPIYQQERRLLAGYTIDVTERETSKQKLAENEAQTRTLIANLPGFVYRCRNDRNWTMIYISDGCAGITGYSAQDLLLNSSRSFSALIKPEFKEKIWESVQSALRSATSFEEEYPILHRDGTERWIWERGRGIYAPNGELHYIEGFITDITRRKNDEARIRELNEKLFLSKKNEALGTLVAGVAHNVNNLLAAIMAAASCGTADSKKSPEIEAFQRIDSLCGRGRELLKSLMKFAKPSLETMIPINIKTIVEEVVTIIKHSTFNQITIAFTAPEDQLWVFGDPGALNSVFMNLCINAVDAMPRGGSLNIALSLIDRNTIGVSVEDTGIGIGKEALTHVFEPFFTTKEPGKGTGLGLSTSFGTIKAHNGSISIESEAGKGTIVHIRLPRIDSPSQEAGISANLSSQSHLSSEKGGGNRISPLKIALVDDDDDVLFLTCKMLEKAGHSVTPLSGGAECLSFITGAKQTGHSPDVIIIDQNMPKMNGVQTIEKLKEISPKIPILLSSGQPDIQEWDSVKQANVAVISKPFNVGEIQAALAAISTQKG